MKNGKNMLGDCHIGKVTNLVQNIVDFEAIRVLGNKAIQLFLQIDHLNFTFDPFTS